MEAVNSDADFWSRQAPQIGSRFHDAAKILLTPPLAQEVARLTTAIGREMAQRERLNRELEIAREVQEHLFPQRLPPVPGLDYCGQCRPAREVGGDYYDFLELPGGRLGISETYPARAWALRS